MNSTTHLPLGVKIECRYTSAPLNAFMVWTGTTLTLTLPLPNCQGIEDFNHPGPIGVLISP